VPNSVVESTIATTSLLAAGQVAAAGAISVKVAALTEGVIKAMLFSKLRSALAVALVFAFLATGTTILACRSTAGQDDKKPTAVHPVEAAAKLEQGKHKEIVTAWGKEVNGLQAGLGFRPGEHRAYHHGETVTLVVRIRNVGNEVVKFSYLQPFLEHSPTVTDSDGKPVLQPNVIPSIGERQPGEVELPPGMEIALHELKRQLRPTRESGSKKFMRPYPLYGTGIARVQYEQVLGPASSGVPGWELNPALSKLTTGKLELEVKEAEQVPDNKENEAVTAWGKEVNGLQAGLGFQAGEKRAYSHGQTVRLVLRVRNVGKKEAKFSFFNVFYLEHPPAVTDGKGKPVTLAGVGRLAGVPALAETRLAPGKEVKLCEMNLELQPVTKKAKGRPWTLYGTGKFQLQYDSVDGSIGGILQIKPDPVLSKLATGKLELEVKDAENLPD